MSIINKNPALTAGLGATLLLVTAFGFEAAGYAPCEMCWWQRYPYMAIAALTIIGMAIGKLHWKLFLYVFLALFLLDAGIAGYHVGVEQKWWLGPTSCTGAANLAGSVADALENLMNEPVVLCDEIAWSLFGISMAGYNFIAASVLSLYCFGAIKKK